MEEGQATLIQAFQSNKQFRKSFPDSLGRAPATPHPSKDFHQEGRDRAGQAEGMSTVRAGIRAPGTWLLQLQGCSAEPVRENSWGLGGGVWEDTDTHWAGLQDTPWVAPIYPC